MADRLDLASRPRRLRQGACALHAPLQRDAIAGDAGAVAFREVRNAPAERFDAGTTKDDVALLQYTGGTTGVSKAATLQGRLNFAS